MVKPPPAMLERLRAQREDMLRSTRLEFAVTVEHVEDKLPAWRGHPYLRQWLRSAYSRRAGDLPIDWYEAISEKCRLTFSNLPWPRRSDAESVSLVKCKLALDSERAPMSDSEIRFVRDQLYVLAEILVDGYAGRTP